MIRTVIVLLVVFAACRGNASSHLPKVGDNEDWWTAEKPCERGSLHIAPISWRDSADAFANGVKWLADPGYLFSIYYCADTKGQTPPQFPETLRGLHVSQVVEAWQARLQRVFSQAKVVDRAAIVGQSARVLVNFSAGDISSFTFEDRTDKQKINKLSAKLEDNKLHGTATFRADAVLWVGEYKDGKLMSSRFERPLKRVEFTGGNGTVRLGKNEPSTAKFQGGRPTGMWSAGSRRIEFSGDKAVAGERTYVQLLRHGTESEKMLSGALMKQEWQLGYLRSETSSDAEIHRREWDALGHVHGARFSAPSGRYGGHRVRYKHGRPDGDWVFWDHCGRKIAAGAIANGTGKFATAGLLRQTRYYWLKELPAEVRPLLKPLIREEIRSSNVCRGTMKHGTWNSLLCTNRSGHEAMQLTFDVQGKLHGKTIIRAAEPLGQSTLLNEAEVEFSHGALRKHRLRRWVVTRLKSSDMFSAFGYARSKWRMLPPPAPCPQPEKDCDPLEQDCDDVGGIGTAAALDEGLLRRSEQPCKRIGQRLQCKISTNGKADTVWFERCQSSPKFDDSADEVFCEARPRELRR